MKRAFWWSVWAWLVVLAALPAVGSGRESEPLQTDRPDFTESSSTVGRGRVQLEAGYVFSYDDADGEVSRAHNFPETLLRVGLTDDIEFRIAWSYLVAEATSGPSEDGAIDLYLGTKLFLMEQEGWLPESAIILQMTVPTGADVFCNDEVFYGFNLLYGWDLAGNWTLGASTGVNTSAEDLVVTGAVPTFNRDGHVVLHQSVTLGIPLTDRLGGFVEYFGLYAVGRENNFPENYLDTGLTYLVTDDFQLDGRIGLGLNDQAQDFFTGAGFSVRF